MAGRAVEKAGVKFAKGPRAEKVSELRPPAFDVLFDPACERNEQQHAVILVRIKGLSQLDEHNMCKSWYEIGRRRRGGAGRRDGDLVHGRAGGRQLRTRDRD